VLRRPFNFLHLLFCYFRFLFIPSLPFAIFNVFLSAYFTNSFLFYSGHKFLFVFPCESVSERVSDRASEWVREREREREREKCCKCHFVLSLDVLFPSRHTPVNFSLSRRISDYLLAVVP
jgi:hypothetical protein